MSASVQLMAPPNLATHAMLAPLLLLAAALAGCAGDPTLSADAVEVTITEYPEAAEAGSEINITWDVAITATANGTEGATFDETGIVYSGNATASGDNVTDWPNSTGQQEDVGPGTFTATFVAEEEGTITVRAYAMVGDHTKMSDEVTILVGANGTGGNNTVTITDGALPQLAAYNPEVLTISAGEAVVWHNEDDATHTATGDGWDTGDIASGEYSEPIVFDEPGEYTYQCTYHPQTMQGTIVVEDGNNTTTGV